MTDFSSYTLFDKATGFSCRAGFQLVQKQVEDVEKLVSWPASLNAMEVGCGKTVVSTVVALMRGHKQKLVVVPPVLMNPWCNWLNKVSDDVLKYQGTPAERKSLQLSKAQWVVVSHAIFRMDFSRLERELDPSLEIIVDEAHALKNSASVLFKKIQRLAS